MDNKLFRHVCFKDLENYFKISDYFSNLTKNEKSIIKQNLEIDVSYCRDNHFSIKQRVQERRLIPGGIYIITDYQFLDENYSSDKYQIITRAVDYGMLDSKVTLVKNNKIMDWEVRYNILEGALGTITYLKDQNGNSAYYDFKNKKVFLESVGYIPTFSKLINGEYVECSNNVYNVTLDKNSNNNLFIVENEYRNVLITNSSNNIFKQDIINTEVSISDAIIENIPVLSTELPSTILTINNTPYLEYLDEETLTKQYVQL